MCLVNFEVRNGISKEHIGELPFKKHGDSVTVPKQERMEKLKVSENGFFNKLNRLIGSSI
jgi:hypothetical protein